MRRVISALAVITLFLCLPVMLRAQYVTFRHDHVVDATGTPVPDGSKVCVQTTDAKDFPKGYRVGVGIGQTMASSLLEHCMVTTGGAIAPVHLIDSSMSWPPGACIRVSVYNPDNMEVRREKCVQTSSKPGSTWCSNSGGSTTCNFDTYPPGGETVAIPSIGDAQELLARAGLASKVNKTGDAMTGPLSSTSTADFTQYLQNGQPLALSDLKAAAADITGTLGFTPLKPANNLSDVEDPAKALANLGGLSSGSALNPNTQINWPSSCNVFSPAAGACFAAVDKAGDTMTGPLILSGDPATALGAATKQYVDSKVSSGAVTKPTYSTNVGGLQFAPGQCTVIPVSLADKPDITLNSNSIVVSFYDFEDEDAGFFATSCIRKSQDDPPIFNLHIRLCRMPQNFLETNRTLPPTAAINWMVF